LKNSPFALVESQECPSDESGWKRKLADNEDFENEFAGASVEDCQKWLLKYQETALFIEPNMIGIADARTAEDGTILVTWYYEIEGCDCPPYGVLPPKPGVFWDFRIRPEQARNVGGDLNYTQSDIFPFYFGHPKDFTDENGVFDTDKMDQAIKREANKAK
jgi:hypothetical protein